MKTSCSHLPEYAKNDLKQIVNLVWAMKNQVQTAEPTACTNDETI